MIDSQEGNINSQLRDLVMIIGNRYVSYLPNWLGKSQPIAIGYSAITNSNLMAISLITAMDQ